MRPVRDERRRGRESRLRLPRLLDALPPGCAAHGRKRVGFVCVPPLRLVLSAEEGEARIAGAVSPPNSRGPVVA
ncbi:hypothetical protein X946_5325 [Burkholderia sp. ABCPW 111]|nr:hypothetical protein X946_5325 [Burkholderia sp. ABCPW 111]